MYSDFDVIVLGGGAAGLSAAGFAAHLGARTLLIESNMLGGECTWTGCIPSKTLLHAAAVAETVRTADRFGISTADTCVDFARVMDLVRSTRRKVYEEHDRPEIFERMGVDVRNGRASFIDSHTVEIAPVESTVRVEASGEQTDRPRIVSGRFFIICTGASPAVLPIPGLAETPFLTYETIFEIRERPEHLLIVGAGPVGIEMAQAFRRLDSGVTVIDKADRILTSDEPDLSQILKEKLEGEGIRFMLGADLKRADGSHREINLELADRHTVNGTALLVVAGKKPNLDSLDLDAADVPYGSKGIRVDDRCRTGVPHIFAAGDVTGRYHLTHMSEHMAKTAVTNALLKVPARIDDQHLPWVTFTDPELAHVGATEADLIEADAAYEIYRFPYTKLDRAAADGRTTGMIVVLASRWRGKILGASVLGARAGELIGELALGMRNGITLRQISDTIHAYPTYGLGVRRAADQWYVRRRYPGLVKTLKKVFGFRGPVIESDPGDVL